MAKDIILDDTGDLKIVNGDFVIGDSEVQNVSLIVSTFEGSWKQFPLQGVGILQYSGSSGQEATLKRSITVKCTADGYQNVEVFLKQAADGTFEYSVTANRT